jgi:LCP family protein required for cell wall assembly
VALTPASWRVFSRRYLIAFVAALVAVVSSVVVLNTKVNDTLAATKRIGNLNFPDGPAEGGNYLVIGSDSRAFVQDAAQAQAFGSPQQEGGQRADVMMVLHVDPATKTNYLVSFPRDLLVNDPSNPGHTTQINGVLNNGPQAVIDLMKQDFDVAINHYVQVDFAAFIGVVDAIGKIGVYFPYPSRDTYTGLNVIAGCSQLDGNGALAYVRSRHLQEMKNGRWQDASPLGDIDRISRQQDFIRKLAAKASAKAGQNPLDAIDIAKAVVPKLHVDDHLSNANILRLVKTFRNVDPKQPGALEMHTLPWNESRSQPGRLEVKQPDAETVLTTLRTFGGTPAAEKKVRPTDVVVSVYNGSDKNGEAGRSLAALQLRGFGPGDTLTATKTAETLVRYKPGELAQAQLVSQYLGGVGRLIEDPTVTDVDVIVVVGADWRGVHGKGQKATAPSTTSTTTAPKTSTTTAKGGAPAPAAPVSAGC